MHTEIQTAIQQQDWHGLLNGLEANGLADAGDGDLLPAMVIYHGETLADMPGDMRHSVVWKHYRKALAEFDPERLKAIRKAMGCQYGDE